MARLTEIEKAQLLRPLGRSVRLQPRLPAEHPRVYLDFVTQMSRLSILPAKPVRFGGNHWKL